MKALEARRLLSRIQDLDDFEAASLVDQGGLFYDAATPGFLLQRALRLAEKEYVVDADGYGDFTSVKEAVDWTAANLSGGLQDPILIRIHPGKYTEEPFTVPEFTFLLGHRVLTPIDASSVDAPRIDWDAGASDSGAFITMKGWSGLWGLDIRVIPWPTVDPAGDTFVIDVNADSSSHRITIDNCHCVISLSAATHTIGDVKVSNGWLYAFMCKLYNTPNSASNGRNVENNSRFTGINNLFYGFGGSGLYNASGTGELSFCNFGALDGSPSLDTDINVAGGTVYAVGANAYRTVSGTVTHRDTALTNIPGLVKQSAAVTDLNQTITDPPTQAEVQAISDKVDELLAAMRTATQLST